MQKQPRQDTISRSVQRFLPVFTQIDQNQAIIDQFCVSLGKNSELSVESDPRIVVFALIIIASRYTRLQKLTLYNLLYDKYSLILIQP